METSNLPNGFPEKFAGPGSTMQISNQGSSIVPPEEKFIHEGELSRVWIEDDNLCATFLWVAKKNIDGAWEMLEDPKALQFRMSLMLFAHGMEPDPGRYNFFAMEPISSEQVLLVAHDYVGPTGRTPLRREEVGAKA